MKKAYTLLELILCLMIVAIITASAIVIVRPKDKTIRFLYSNLFHSLDRAAYNVICDGYEVFSNSSDKKGDEELCKGLIEYINTKEDSCSAPITNIKADSFPQENVKFISSNGMKFYISDMIEDEETNISFYIIFVDINGDKLPNSALYEPNVTDPDIFAFAAFKSGRIMPIGAPEIDPKYALTRVVHYDEDANGIYSKASQPYYKSKSEAWGFYSDPEVEVDKICDVGEVYTCNDFVRKLIPDDSLLKKNVDFPIDDLPPVNEEYTCSAKNYDSCSVIIDKYVK